MTETVTAQGGLVKLFECINKLEALVAEYGETGESALQSVAARHRTPVTRDELAKRIEWLHDKLQAVESVRQNEYMVARQGVMGCVLRRM